MEVQIVSDSDSGAEDNQMVVDAAHPNIMDPDGNNIPIEVITDSEGESLIDSEQSDNNSLNDLHKEPVTDTEDDEDEDVAFNLQRPTFTLNAEVQGLNRDLTAAGNVQALEKFLLTVAKALRYKESYTSMIASFKMANLEFDNVHFPENMRTFWRCVNRRTEDFTNVVVSTVCWDQLGRGKKPEIDCTCGECGPNRSNTELGTFLYINVQSQIRRLLNKHGITQDLEYRTNRRKQREDAIEDVYDGTEYLRHSRRGGFLHPDRRNYSLAIWADSVSPIKSANVHITPVFVQIFELSPRARQQNSILAAVYVGPVKPNMIHFLTPVADELRVLHRDGITWQSDGNEEVTSRFLTLILSADSEERYVILGMTRHNGECGCTFCYANGEEIEGHPRIYPRNDGNAADRTDAEIRRDAEVAANTDVPQRGVLAISALTRVPGFDLRIGQLVEPMHCLWEGNFVRLYNNLTNYQIQDHIPPSNIATIGNRIKSIRTPTKLSRLPRDLTRFVKFTATEIRNTAWFYWLPCSHDFIRNNDHLRICSIFAEATFILNKDSILPNELGRAQELLLEYRRRFEELFPREQLVYNLHLLKHTVRCVRELGPAWVASGFWFESLNRQVVNYLTSPTDRASQVACRMLLAQMIEHYLDRDDLNPGVLNLLREFIGKERWDEQPDVTDGTYVRRDGDTLRVIEQEEMDALMEAGFVNLGPHLLITVHKKNSINGVKYQPRNRRPVKYNNSIAYVNAQYHCEVVEFIEILSIFTWEYDGNERSGMIGRRFRIIQPAFETTYIRVVVPLNNVLTP